MKRLLFLFLIFSVCSCKDKIANTNPLTINLKNNLGVLTIIPPPTMDTSYSWTNMNDTKCGDLSMTRMANKRYCLSKESGFINHEVVDSLYQLTIMQNEHPDCKSQSEPDYVDFAKLKIKLYQTEKPRTKVDVKIIYLNNREYVILTRNSIVNSKHNISLSATTFINKESISIVYNYYGYAPSDFTKTINESLRTLEINNSH